MNNKSEVEKYAGLISQLSKDGTPWIPSERSRFLNSLQKEKDAFVKRDEIEYDKAYVLAENFGSVYDLQAGRSVGYFLVGSLIIFDGENDRGYEVSLAGTTFHVTVDAGFGNRPSEFIMPELSESGTILRDHTFPPILEYEHVSEMLKNHLLSLGKVI